MTAKHLMSNMRLTGTASPLRSRRAAARPQSATFFHLGNSGCHSALNDSSRAGGCNDAVRVNSDQYADARLTPKEQTELRDVHSPRFAMFRDVGGSIPIRVTPWRSYSTTRCTRPSFKHARPFVQLRKEKARLGEENGGPPGAVRTTYSPTALRAAVRRCATYPPKLDWKKQ